MAAVCKIKYSNIKLSLPAHDEKLDSISTPALPSLFDETKGAFEPWLAIKRSGAKARILDISIVPPRGMLRRHVNTGLIIGLSIPLS